jgi:hypothetical protein
MKNLVRIMILFATLLSAEAEMEYQLSLVGMHMDYREYDRNGIILDSEKSNFSEIIGIDFSYRYLINNNSAIEFNLMSMAGDTEYVGSYIGSGQPYGSVVSKTYNKVRDISLFYNAKNSSDYGVIMLGGVGFGYRYWDRELSAVQLEEYKWYSLRANIGLEYQYEDIVAAFKVGYQYGIKPAMSASGFSEDFNLASADILKISLPLRYKLNESFDFFSEYVFEYQTIKESDVLYDSAANGYVEPDSTAYNQYLKVGIVFKY